MVRLNITMPDDLVKQLKRVRNKSGFIAQALREKLQREEHKKLEQRLIEGYKESRIEDQKINAEWGRATLQDGLA